jgi:hypothetical protein
MQSTITRCCALGLAIIALGTGLPVPASAASPPALVAAVKRGDCATAISQVNSQSGSMSDQTAFVAGRMLDEGLCVKQDSVAAAQYFERAADLGNKNAKLDYAAKVGLGEGSAQSYEIAGDICRSAGFDPQTRLSQYSLGYACTVLAVAGKHLRETLPTGAFVPGRGPALIDFSPASADIEVRATPQVGRGEAATGSIISRPLIDAQQEIKKAWRYALVQVPKPDATRLENRTVELSLDVDMTLEADREAVTHSGITATDGILLQGDFRQAGGVTTAGH